MADWSVILDIGQYSSKIGWGGENEPRSTFITVVGTPKYQQMVGSPQSKQVYVGNEIIDALGLYKISYPIEKGDITDWTQFKSIIDYIFYVLRVDPTAVNVLYTSNPFLSYESKEKLFKLFLEDYQVMAFYPVRGSLLTMYSGGFDTGIVIDMGASNIRITPIFQGFIIKHAAQYLEIGGNMLDEFMMKKVLEVGFSAETSVQRELVRVLKERACFVSMDFEADRLQGEKYKQDYALPDGSTISIGEERFIVPELLFKPDLFTLEETPFHKAIVACIDMCDIDIRTELMQNIFLTGGSSMFEQLEHRIKKEVENELLQNGKVMPDIRIIAPKERVLSNWVGGSILSKIPEFQNNWISRKQYFESGLPSELVEF